MKTITRNDVADAIYNEVGLSRRDSNEILDMIVKELSDTLISGKNVKISSFGSFLLRKKNERIGRNPRNGELATITPRTVVSFKPSLLLRKKLNRK